MKALQKVKHYNQAWLILEAFAESLSRIFLNEHVSDNHLEILNTQNADISNLLMDPMFQKYADVYADKLNDGLSGMFGKTAQFWLKYITLVDILHKFHSAIQSNDFDEKLESWRLMMPWFFCFDRTHYSR